jgi:hypothetical protein
MHHEIFLAYNPHTVMSAKAANEITISFSAFKIFEALNKEIYEAAMQGRRSVRYEVFRNEKYEACKMYQSNETLTKMVKQVMAQGYQVVLMIDEDMKAKEYFMQMVVSW